MSSCEKCYWDASLRFRFEDPSKSRYQHYCDLLEERKDNPCTLKEQAGEFWDEEKQCDRRDL